MSAPNPDGGRPVTLPVGGAAQLLTEYAVGNPPTLLVNISTDRAWIGADSSVSPASGVPLDPGTALPWTGQGSVYGASDPGAANPITVYITSAIAGWTPSPATIAAQVATELLASGIPNVLREQELINTAVTGTFSENLDVHGYASAEIILSTQDNAQITITQTDDNGTTTDLEKLQVGGPNIVSPTVRARLALSGTRLVISGTLGPVSVNLTVIASNRPAAQRLDTRSNVANGDLWRFTGTMASGNNYQLVQNDPSVQLQGQVFLNAVVTGTTVTGYFILSSPALPYPVILATTAEMTTVPGSTQRSIEKMIALPAGGGYLLEFACAGTGGAATAQAILFQG